MSYVAKNLLPNENIVYETRLHWFIYLRPVLFLAIGVVVAVTADLQPDFNPLFLGAGVAIVIGLIDFFWRWIVRRSSEFAVTDARVLIKTGIIRRTSLEIIITKIESIEVSQGIMGRIFGYGTIVVIGTGGTNEPFHGIAHPLEFRRQVQAVAIARL
jgi:uncharacterized membrane protein YdbT with pleckstrin-like domain